jgi:hypothetical protein
MNSLKNANPFVNVCVDTAASVMVHRGRSKVRDCTIAPQNCTAGVIQQDPSPMMLATSLVDLSVLVQGEVYTEGCGRKCFRYSYHTGSVKYGFNL